MKRSANPSSESDSLFKRRELLIALFFSTINGGEGSGSRRVDAGRVRSVLQLGNCAVLVAGGVAGVVTWACATPMDVVKARLQMCGGGGRMYSGVLNCITVSVREEGMRVFFKGLLLNTVRAFPVNAVTFLSFEMLLRAMTDSSQD